MERTKYPNSYKLRDIVVASANNAPAQRITFADYMDLVLYHPQYGYYSSGTVGIGKRGDFFTSSSLGKDFGELLGTQFVEMWHKLDCPRPFQIVEMGAGNGVLAKDILQYLSREEEDFTSFLQYIIVEQSPQLIVRQQELLQSLTDIDLSWQTWDEIADNSIGGVFFANELVDAFPVHRIAVGENKLEEIYLTTIDNKFTEVTGELSTSRIPEYFDLLEIDLKDEPYPVGYRTEVNLQALDWIATINKKLNRGYLLTIDYGYTADKYYHPRKNRGTLQCYYQHRHHDDPYINLGYQDLTAHVNFTALERQGELCGLEKIGFTQQGLFLMALGLGDRLNELSSGKYNVKEIFHRRDALHQLINPTGLGGFGVLIQGKGLNKEARSLLGLNIPELF